MVAPAWSTTRPSGVRVLRGPTLGGWLQAQIVRLAPVDIEACAAAVAPHGAGVSFNRLALAATGTHGVAVAPARRQPDGVLRPRHDGPATGWGLDNLQKGGGDLQRLPAHFEHHLQRADLPDPIPGAPAQPDIQVRLQSSPLHAGHNSDLTQSNDESRSTHSAGLHPRTVWRLTGCAVPCITPYHYSPRGG